MPNMVIMCGPQNALQMRKPWGSDRESCPHRHTAGQERSLIHISLPFQTWEELSKPGTWDLGTLAGMLLNLQTIACPLPVWLPPAASTAQSSRRGTKDRCLLIDLNVHHSIHHSMLSPLTLILIAILQSRYYYPVSHMRKLNFGESINLAQATQLVTASCRTDSNLGLIGS